MKRTFKFSFLALAITLSVAACSSNQSGDDAQDSTAEVIDSTAEVTQDSLSNMVDTVDSAAEAKIDSLKK